MPNHNTIVASGHPIGRFIKGYVSGTPLPGTVMQVKAATRPVKGLFTYEAFKQSASGDRSGAVIVLIEDEMKGLCVSDAYVDGALCQMYIPAEGELLNMLVSAAGTGTTDAIAIGDKLMVNDGDGLLIGTTGDPESEPFTAMETKTDVSATGTLTLCQYTGH